MKQQKLLQHILDREGDLEAAKMSLFEEHPAIQEAAVGTVEYAINAVIDHVRARLQEREKSTSLREILPPLLGMEDDREARTLIERAYADRGAPCSATDILEVVASAEHAVISSFVEHAIRRMRELSGRAVETLLRNLLQEAERRGIERSFVELASPEPPPPVTPTGRLRPPVHFDLDAAREEADAIQIADLLREPLLEELGIAVKETSGLLVKREETA